MRGWIPGIKLNTIYAQLLGTYLMLTAFGTINICVHSRHALTTFALSPVVRSLLGCGAECFTVGTFCVMSFNFVF
ncbi:hypothetical protein [Nostoc sp. UHCC 0251]|uniref:hypothetical protein n=1 Tax=Nostoc sp. UHCC 0251 TaxID=3110240 RepID=UPI002B1F4075|nr:hypothetical protein [Nostoc sp. UHCC 0251]MEA5627684.1 hypothetical protein [Nostoc sp. UHCC 0251]